jgi:predicted dehydrogenase
MRVAVIGTGFGARVVAPVFDATDGCDVVAVVSARDDAEALAAIRRADVDLVSIHSPPFLHARHVRAALEHRKAVLCDKPFGLGADEADALVRDARDAGVVALCNFEFRYAPARQLLAERVADGALGRIEHLQWVHLSAGSRSPLRPWGWLFDRARGGGFIGAWGSHAVDTVRYLFGDIQQSFAVPRIDIPERFDADGVMHRCTAEDGFSAVFVLVDGVTAAIDAGFAASVSLAPRLTVFGSAAVCEIVGDERVTIRRVDGTRAEISLASEVPQHRDHHTEAMRRFANVVRDALTTGEIPAHAPTFADGAATALVLDALRSFPFATT